jgi:endoglucanase
VEVVVASDHPEIDRKVAGEVSLGRGPVVMRGSNINPVVGGLLVEAARRRKIPVQMEGFPGPTPTDASVMQVSREGIATALVKVPVRYLHTPCEIISAQDLDRAAALLSAFLKALEPGVNLNPVSSS